MKTRHSTLRIIAVLAILIANLALPLAVHAATAVDVTITAFPGGLWPPTPFTVTWVSDTNVQLDWTPPFEAAQTYIRMKVGEAPENVTDGYAVYLGAGMTTNDIESNLDEMAGIVWYSAWSVGGDGSYSAEHAEGSVEGAGMQAIATTFAFFGILAFIALLNILAFTQKNEFLYVLIVPVNFTYGLYYAQTSILRHEFIIGVVVAIIGLFCLFRAVFMGLEGIRTKRRDNY